MRHGPEARRYDIGWKPMLLRQPDDGRGFDPAARSGGNGLGNMQVRAQKIGGELMIETRPGGGTVLRFAGDIR